MQLASTGNDISSGVAPIVGVDAAMTWSTGS